MCYSVALLKCVNANLIKSYNCSSYNNNMNRRTVSILDTSNGELPLGSYLEYSKSRIAIELAPDAKLCTMQSDSIYMCVYISVNIGHPGFMFKRIYKILLDLYCISLSFVHVSSIVTSFRGSNTFHNIATIHMKNICSLFANGMSYFI